MHTFYFRFQGISLGFRGASQQKSLSLLSLWHCIHISILPRFIWRTLSNSQKRLDTLAETGLKLWITELDFQNSDINIRAQGYKDALRLFFSHPAVEGIIMWAPWDLDNGGKPSALVEGNNFDVSQSHREYFIIHTYSTVSSDCMLEVLPLLKWRKRLEFFFFFSVESSREQGEILDQWTVEDTWDNHSLLQNSFCHIPWVLWWLRSCSLLRW